MTKSVSKSDEEVLSTHQQMLALAVVQIKCILEDGSDSVTDLTESFINIANLLDTTIKNQEMDGQVESQLQSAHDSINQGIIAFQFYDRITQRLDHICSSLDQISNLMSDEDRRAQREQWENLKNGVKERYTMESETIVYEKILSGESVETAMAAYRDYQQKHYHAGNDDDVEFF